jgi:uncharacterized protein (TIGR03067 family)
MSRRVILTVLIGFLAAISARADDSKNNGNQDHSAAEMKKLEGNWRLTRQEVKGNLWPSGDGENGIFIEGDKIFWTRGGKEGGGQKGDLTIDPTISPKSIDVEITRGSFIGKKWLGIYQIKGDKLTICWGEPGGDKRPKKFVTKTAVGAGHMLETYQSLDGVKAADVKKQRESKKSAGQDEARATAKQLEGNWVLTRQEVKGDLWPSGDGENGIFIEGDKIFWTRGGKEGGGQKGDLTVDPSTNPKSIDVEITRGSFIGKKWLGIYQIKGDKLTICWGEPGGDKRPKKFVTKTAVGAGHMLETYKKQKE